MNWLVLFGFILWLTMGVTYFLIWLIHIKGTFHMTNMGEVEEHEIHSKKIAKKWTICFLILNIFLLLLFMY